LPRVAVLVRILPVPVVAGSWVFAGSVLMGIGAARLLLNAME
jgi:hypothetical protein